MVIEREGILREEKAPERERPFRAGGIPENSGKTK